MLQARCSGEDFIRRMVRLATIKGLAMMSYFLVYLRKCVCVCVHSVCIVCACVCVCPSICVCGRYVCQGYMFVVGMSVIDVWGMGAWVYRYVLWNCGNSVTSRLLKSLISSKEYLCVFVTSS